MHIPVLYIYANNKYVDKIIVIVILVSTNIRKKCSIAGSILKRKMIEWACNKYKKLIHKLKKP